MAIETELEDERVNKLNQLEQIEKLELDNLNYGRILVSYMRTLPLFLHA